VSDLPTSARTDPRVDFHSPANWFGVTTEPRPDRARPNADNDSIDDDVNDDDDNKGSSSREKKASMRLRVTKLEMPNNGLAGSLPIVPLGQLSELEILNLSGQAFSSVSMITITLHFKRSHSCVLVLIFVCVQYPPGASPSTRTRRRSGSQCAIGETPRLDCIRAPGRRDPELEDGAHQPRFIGEPARDRSECQCADGPVAGRPHAGLGQ
jgi:hypothetical protein